MNAVADQSVDRRIVGRRRLEHVLDHSVDVANGRGLGDDERRRREQHVLRARQIEMREDDALDNITRSCASDGDLSDRRSIFVLMATSASDAGRIGIAHGVHLLAAADRIHDDVRIIQRC